MADELPRQSWMTRNSYVVVGAIVVLLGALTWLVSMPFGSKPTPPVTQTSAPQPVAADSAARAAEERIATERATADERAFADATQADTIAAFETYIRTNPGGARIAEAQQRIVALNEQARRAAEQRAAAELATARAAEERAAAERAAAERATAAKATDDQSWSEATQAGTVAAFEAYVRNNPAGTRIAEAQQRIAALNEQARRAAEERATAERAASERAAAEQAAAARAAEERAAAERAVAERAAAAKAADDRAWVEAAQAGTVAALEAYVRNNPAGTRVTEAQQRIAIINEQTRRVAEERATAERLAVEKAAAEKVAAERAADDKAFADATQAGSIAAFEAYIRNNAVGAHLIEAARRIAQLREDERAKQAAAAKPVRTTSSVDSNRPYVPQRPVYKAPPLQR